MMLCISQFISTRKYCLTCYSSQENDTQQLGPSLAQNEPTENWMSSTFEPHFRATSDLVYGILPWRWKNTMKFGDECSVFGTNTFWCCQS